MKIIVGVLLCLSVFLCAEEKVDIHLWHAFDGPLEKTFVEIIEDFNHNSGSYRVIPIRKGTYKEVFELGIQSYKDQNPPHILQIYEVATLTAMLMPRLFIPVDALMRSYHKKFDPDIYIDAVRNFYSTSEGKMMSFPWNASTGILFYNRDLFKQVGLDPEKSPKTWNEIEEISPKFVKAGLKGFTTAWPAAYHLEHISTWHNLPFATKENGLGGLGARLCFNAPEQIFHLSKVAEWQKNGIFTYCGRFNETPENLFTEGKCAMLLQGANRMPLLKQKASFPVGVGYLPYWSQIAKKPFNLNIGGASFWVISGFSDKEYRGIVQFFEYLSATEVQAFWHQATGYLPITEAAYYLTKKKGQFYKEHPEAEIAVLEVMGNSPTPNTKGIRLGNYITVRDIIIDQMEKIFSGEISAKAGLDKAVELGNQKLEEFENSVEKVSE